MSDLARLAERRLDWPACFNTRDLGGLPTRAGTLTRRGAVIRSDLLARLTPEGWHALVDYGVRTIIDLRWPFEIETDPYTLPDTAVDSGVRYLPLQLVGELAGEPDASSATETLEEAYVDTLDNQSPRVAAVLRAIATAGAGGVLIHCHGGRDRTAIVSALLLALAGVPHVIIAADYQASQAMLWRLWEKMVARAGSEDAAGIHFKPLLEESTMIYMLDHLSDRYGGVKEYLAHIGLTGAEREALVSRLRP